MAQGPKLPRIECIANGPLKVTIGPAPEAPCLRRDDGTGYPHEEAVWLCRCGGSKTKPFCDGTHKRNAFSDKRLTDGADDRRKTYSGRHIDVHDNRALCAHAGYCTDELAEVFHEQGSPWIVPDAAAVEKVIALVRKCPSGALSYSGSESLSEKWSEPDPASITVTKDGPYAVRGEIELVGVQFGAGAARERYTLCRCGASKNKPFCDGSHWGIEFRDPV